MATAVKDLTVDDLRQVIAETVRQTLEDYLDDLRLLLPGASQPLDLEREEQDPRPMADRPLKPSLDH